MAMSEKKGLMAHCDKDGCKAVRWGTRDELPVGLHGSVQVVREDEEGDVIVESAEWFACKQHHIAGAVMAALTRDAVANTVNASQRLRDLDAATHGRVSEVAAVAS